VAVIGAALGCQQPRVAALPAPETTIETQSPASVSVTHVVDSVVTTRGMTGAAVIASVTAEPLISINFPTPVDVRIPLRMIAAMGHYGLVVPPEVSKKIAVTLDSVPVSVALKAVLQGAGLALVPTEPQRARLPFDTAVVFFQLPVNVDSLSIDAIMKRFGVSRDIAAMLVLSRIKP
jgi:hypothetical protein